MKSFRGSVRRGTGRPVRVLLGLGLVLAAAQTAVAQDPENCLACHRFRGLSRLDQATNELRLFFCNADDYIRRQGPHARLRCTDCHEKSEVKVVPHQVQTPVDCTRTCHIAPATGTALQFSHQRVADSLVHSVHSAEHIGKLKFDEPLLRPGQSNCLYCHDEPTFGLPGGVPAGFLTNRGGTRCDTCHAEELPLEVAYFSKHVAARMKPARSIRQLAQVCGVCHSDPKLVEQMGSHDAVGSYLHSFHGKASLLGSTQTATCIECHASGIHDQHRMLPKTELASSIHPGELADTCRTTVCHPGAPPGMSQAAVHLELDVSKFPLEFYVAAFFILMTATVMLIFFLLIVLELFNAALRGTNPEDRRLMKLARLLREHPEGRRLIQRMTPHQRFQHWGLVITFALLVATGMPIKFAAEDWARPLVAALGGLTIARWIHRVAGVTLIAVFLYHVGYLTGLMLLRIRADRAAGVRKSLLLRLWEFPMLIRPADIVEFWHLTAYLLFIRKERPHTGQFSFTQKFEYWAVFWGVPVMGLSGLALWGMPVVSEWIGGRLMNFAFIIHSDEAYLAFIYIATVHLFGVIFAPAVFPLSLGTLTGQAPALELAQAHRPALQKIADELDVMLPDHAHHAPRGLAAVGHAVVAGLRRGYSVIMIGAYGLLAFVSLRFLVLMLATHEAAPVEIVGIPKRLDADKFLAAAAQPGMARAPIESRPRGPLAHYHQIPQWFQADPGNTCTTSGCHAPLPHGKRVEVRAFLNMHATFVDCRVCHVATGGSAVAAGWLSLPQREPITAPPILTVGELLESLAATAPADAAALNSRLIGLMEQAAAASGGNEQLAHWLARLKTTNPDSRVWRQLVEEIRIHLSLHVHGEYGAKIALYEAGQPQPAPTGAQQAATREYLSGKDRLSETQRKQLLDTIHVNTAPTGAMCTPCHSATPALVDVGKLGYPPSRVTALEESAVMRSILSIEAGQPFFLPLGQEGQP